MENYFEIDSLNVTKWHNCYRDIEIDFYSYLDSILSKPNSTYNDQILDFEATKVSTKENDPNRAKRLLNLLKANSHLKESEKLDIIKGLFCWQVQFTDLNTVEYISNFVEKNFELQSKKALANYMIKSKLKSTLSFSILSGCLNMVKLLVETYDCELNNIYANQMNDVHYCIQNNQVIILEYLLKKHSSLLERKEYSIMIDKQVLSPLDVAIQTSSLECIKLILEFYANSTANFFEFVHDHQLMKISECVNCVMSKESSFKDLKMKLMKILFEKCNLSMATKYGVQIENGLVQTIFSTYCTNENMFLFSYVFDTLKKQTNNQTDLYVIDTILLKLEQSFDLNKKLIEELLKHVNNKRFLIKRLYGYRNGDLWSVKDEHLQSKITSIESKFMQNSYFQREQMFLNFGLLTEKVCLMRLTDFILQWSNTCSNRSSFVSASTTKRYLTAKEMIDLVEWYLFFLIKSGFIQLNSKHFKSWHIDLNNRLDKHLEIKSQFDYIIKQICAKFEKQKLFTLKLLSRNTIRQSIRSLSEENVQALDLYPSLSDYLLNKIHF